LIQGHVKGLVELDGQMFCAKSKRTADLSEFDVVNYQMKMYNKCNFLIKEIQFYIEAQTFIV